MCRICFFLCVCTQCLVPCLKVLRSNFFYKLKLCMTSFFAFDTDLPDACWEAAVEPVITGLCFCSRVVLCLPSSCNPADCPFLILSCQVEALSCSGWHVIFACWCDRELSWWILTLSLSFARLILTHVPSKLQITWGSAKLFFFLAGFL